VRRERPGSDLAGIPLLVSGFQAANLIGRRTTAFRGQGRKHAEFRDADRRGAPGWLRRDSYFPPQDADFRGADRRCAQRTALDLQI